MSKLSKLFFAALLLVSLIVLFLVFINRFVIYDKFSHYKFKNTDKVNKIKQYDSAVSRYKNPGKIYYILTDENGNNISGDIFSNYNRISGNENLIVKVNDKYGVINLKTGKKIIPAIYYSVNYNSKEGVFKARLVDGKQKINDEILFDKDGKKIIQARSVSKSGDYYIILDDNNTFYLLDKNFKKLLDFDFDSRTVIVNDNYILLNSSECKELSDLKGNIIIPALYKNIYFYKNINGKDFFRVSNKGINAAGIVDSDNKVIVPLIFSSCAYDDISQSFWCQRMFKTKDSKSSEVKWANYNLEGQLIENPDFSYFGRQVNTINRDYKYEHSILNQSDETKKNVRKIVKVNVKNKYILLTKDEIAAYSGCLAESESIKIKLPKIPPAPVSPHHKTNYKSDFLNKAGKNKHIKLTCREMEKDSSFCKLSPNALSAKYSGGQNYYIADTGISKGKYYFEFQIENSSSKEISKNTKFSIIHFPIYKTHKDAQMYSESWKSHANKKDFNTGTSKAKSGDIIGIAIDFNNGRLYESVNGKWLNNPYNPSQGTQFHTKEYNPAFSVAGYNEVLTVNFGKLPFKYKVPNGYIALDNN